MKLFFLFSILFCCKGQGIIDSIKNYTEGIIQSHMTEKILSDFAPLLLPLTLLMIILFQLMKICFRRQKFYDKLPQTENEFSKKINVPLWHKVQLIIVRYYCQLTH